MSKFATALDSAIAGQHGSLLVTDTNLHTALTEGFQAWGEIYAVAACVITVANAYTTGMWPTLVSAPLAAGQSIKGLWTAVRLTSGTAILYAARVD